MQDITESYILSISSADDVLMSLYIVVDVWVVITISYQLEVNALKH